MKKVLLIALSLALGFGTMAQDSQWWIGGQAGFNSGSEQDNPDPKANTSSWSFGPSFGYMLNEQMSVGLNLNLMGTSYKWNDADNSIAKTMGWEVAPLFRYYLPVTDNFKFFGDAEIGFGGGSSTFDDDNVDEQKSEYSTLRFGINPGLQYWFTPKWSMLTSIGLLGYNSRTDNKGETDGQGNSTEYVTTNFGINANFSTLRFGLFYHF